ncbi:MAG: histidinol dehydrogenase [Candidatus Melainabacteria bacterium]|nr:histidinol dehydrogenase [Candidatus Melainabacteria bacterium]
MIEVYVGSAADRFLADLTKPFNSSGIAHDARQTEAQSAKEKVEDVVKQFIETVRTRGDQGIVEIATKLKDIPANESDATASSVRADAAKANRFLLSEAAIAAAVDQVDEATRKTLQIAAERIKEFGSAVVKSIKSTEVDCGEFQTGIDHRPVRRVACYVPSGRYPLPSTALMTAVTAQVAGVEEIVIISPRLEKEIIYAGTIAGVKEFYQIGGAQAVAAMAFGTETIRSVDMVVGPGNAYVTEAKRQLQGVIGIDMLAGPSEICVIADDNADPNWLSLDLLSQAEHDPDARAYLLTTNKSLAKKVAARIIEDVKRLGLPDFLSESLAGSAILVLDSIDQCCEAANKIAPEHLLLAVSNPEELKLQLTNYGALFLGYGCTVAFGDYMAGPNHTLPTNRSAKFQGCLSPLTFLRAQSWIRVKTQAPSLAVNTADFANIEGLTAHAAAAKARASCTTTK